MMILQGKDKENNKCMKLNIQEYVTKNRNYSAHVHNKDKYIYSVNIFIQLLDGVLYLQNDPKYLNHSYETQL